ncbi:MAG: anthranilate synthase component [Candidatus Saccharibacteria bacterium]|nr:anthranilate synthase component [Candidatus Saccharibacteria bacterium]
MRLRELIEEKLGPVEFTLRDPREMQPKDVKEADLMVISGGVGRSIEKNPETFTRVVQAAAAHKKPTIGICLGAEAIVFACGGVLQEMPVRRVGNVRTHFTDSFAQELAWREESTMAYEFHKWLIMTLPDSLEALGRSKDGVEIFRHNSLPMWGLQFHPEVRRLDNKGHLIFEHVLNELGIRTKSNTVYSNQ